MLIRSLCSSKLQYLSLRCFSSATPHVLKPGDVLRKARLFTEEDVLQYSKPGAVYVSQSLNFKFPVYIGDEVIGEVQATNLRVNKSRYLAKFKTRCFKNGELVVIEGEAVAMLPTLTVE
ncbi:HotDog domain superfamily [Sesbania bispinosa]|nr:HotDog domain superfamily [Sesbania bispinosa]